MYGRRVGVRQSVTIGVRRRCIERKVVQHLDFPRSDKVKGAGTGTNPQHFVRDSAFGPVITRLAIRTLALSVAPNNGASEEPTSMEPARAARRPDASGDST